MLLLTRGIAVTRPTLLFSEYFCAIVSAFVFFAVSISVSAFIAQAPSLAWIVFTSIIYILLYSHLLSLIMIQIRSLRGISMKLTPDMPQDLLAPIYEKEFTFKVFLFLLVGFIAIEICGQCMYALSYISMESLVLAYEIPSWILMAALGWYFRPRKFSPYFFMLPADSSDTAALQEGQIRYFRLITRNLVFYHDDISIFACFDCFNTGFFLLLLLILTHLPSSNHEDYLRLARQIMKVKVMRQK